MVTFRGSRGGRKPPDGKARSWQSDRGFGINGFEQCVQLGSPAERAEVKSSQRPWSLSLASEIRHCREVAPTPETLDEIERSLRSRNEQAIADLVCFLAYSGLRIGEAI